MSCVNLSLHFLLFYLTHAPHFRLKAVVLCLYCLRSRAYSLNALVHLYQDYIYIQTNFHSQKFDILQLFGKLKEADCTIVATNFCIDFCTDAFKGKLHSLSFPYTFSFGKLFIFKFAMSRAFHKFTIYHSSRTFNNQILQ